MSVQAIVGANWGDEGKGKLVDHLAAQADYVVRFQGGKNAGHTVINALGKFALHLLPSGVFYPEVTNILGPGVAVDVAALVREYQQLTEAGVADPRIAVSHRAQLVLPYHELLDRLEEERLGANQFGSTRSGIAPFYADKHLKLGIQLADLFDQERLVGRIESALAGKNVLFEHLYGVAPLDAGEITERLVAQASQIEPFVADTTAMLHDALASEQSIILEGQLGALRDVDHGIYPFTTSSSTLAGFAPVGAGIPPYEVTTVTAVVKAYSSCVGAGPFVSELSGELGDELRRLGGDSGEYGATTGRPRRVGWFDVVASRYGCQIQGATEVAVTLLDVLGFLDEIPVCVAYRVGGRTVSTFPTTAELHQAVPILERLPGWHGDISHVRDFSQLPPAARDYVLFIESALGVPVRYVSVGSHRDALIRRD